MKNVKKNAIFFKILIILVQGFCPLKIKNTVCSPVSGWYQHLDTWNKNSIFEAPFSVLGKCSISNESWTLFLALRWKFWRVESLRNSHRRQRSVQLSKLFMANVYAVYRAAKLLLLRKGWVICDTFKETVLYLKWRYLYKEVRFSESLLILLKIRFVWNNRGQKHSLNIDVRCPVSDQFFLAVQNQWISCVHYSDKIYFISITITKA